MDKLLLGNRIKEARTARDMTLDELASAIGLNKSTISRYERGEIETPKLPVIEAIADKTCTNPAWLIGKSEMRSYTPSTSTLALYAPGDLFRPLRTLREARGLSVDDAAYAIGISAKDYAAIENGHNVDCMTLARIATFYCCSTDFILSFDGVVDRDEEISAMSNKILRLHYAFNKLSPEDQEQVIDHAQSLAGLSVQRLRMAARDGTHIDRTVTPEEADRLRAEMDAAPRVTDDELLL